MSSSGSESSPPEPTANESPSLRGVLKTSATPPLTDDDSSPRRAAPIRHNVNFQTVLPGYPVGYFMGILPPCPLGQIYPPDGCPGYDYTQVPDHTLDTPYLNSLYQPTIPDPMYCYSMPWCAFPYGIPVPLPKKPKTPSPIPSPSPEPPTEMLMPVVVGVIKKGTPLGFWGGRDEE